MRESILDGIGTVASIGPVSRIYVIDGKSQPYFPTTGFTYSENRESSQDGKRWC